MENNNNYNNKWSITINIDKNNFKWKNIILIEILIKFHLFKNQFVFIFFINDHLSNNICICNEEEFFFIIIFILKTMK